MQVIYEAYFYYNRAFMGRSQARNGESGVELQQTITPFSHSERSELAGILTPFNRVFPRKPV
jgi:hypothetical protein